ncbi:MAG TPA: hypothetical protein PKA90_07995 [Ignavibacteria bacterium]|nr:hypothetical protein [Ignavibacteria bacterium]HMR40360.1 hypothetical protein [Ignavibacteria bacterium]
MKSKFKLKIFEVIAIALLFVTIYSCSDDDNNPVVINGPVSNSVNGVVNFVDTNFILTGGTYLISAYPSTGWPPMGGPTAYDTIKIARTNNVLNTSYNYQLRDLPTGDYVVSVGFRKSVGGQSPVMSVYGCDTLRTIYPAGLTCFLNPTLKATIGSNNEAAVGIDMLSWADTTYKVY